MLLRQIRGAIGIALVWAVVWFPLGIGLGVWRYLSAPFSDEMYNGAFVRLPAFPIISNVVAIWTVWGAISGLLFALILSVAESRRSVAELSIKRLSVWGALGAAGLPTVFIFVIAKQEGWQWWLLVPLTVALALGGTCAALTALAATRTARAASQSRLTSA